MSKVGEVPISQYVQMDLIRNGFICHMMKLEVFITGQDIKQNTSNLFHLTIFQLKLYKTMGVLFNCKRS